MAKLTLTASPEEASRMNGCVCTNGSRLWKFGRENAGLDQYEVVFVESCAKPDLGQTHRNELTAQEVATFVRNYLDEGFDGQIRIG